MSAGLAFAAPRSDPAAPATCLHVFPSFEIGGVALRTVRIINHLGAQFRHTIIALNGDFGAARNFEMEGEVNLLPPRRPHSGTLGGVLSGAAVLRRLRPQLLLTYNWGAIEWAIANRLLRVSRHIHHEAGFGKEEADGQLWRRVVCRRWALTGCVRVVVPSRWLEDLARRVWKLPPELVTYVPEGVDPGRFAALRRDKIPGFERRPGELVVGTVAPLRPEKNIGRLLRAFALLGDGVAARLIIAGDGAERGAIERLAVELGIAQRVLFTGYVQPETVLGSFDVFALSSDTEQMPIALLEAMAAGRAVAAVDVGDVKAMVGPENQRFVVPRDDAAALAGAIRQLLSDRALCERLGRANRARAAAEFSQERTFAGYERLFAEALSERAH